MPGPYQEEYYKYIEIKGPQKMLRIGAEKYFLDPKPEEMESKENHLDVDNKVVEIFGAKKIDQDEEFEIKETKSEKVVKDMVDMFQDLDNEKTETIQNYEK